ncbi:MAG: hypothetical protein C4527_11665 [Candidatus Omnitrophota bacterium]|jgi:hypothetical protein|nr:MAG: hypothetical protein C4527_11665 [Candidatus Omnitrophota bacterium]
MAVKPNPSTILDTYSLEEILDLAKEKEKRNKDEHMAEAKRYLDYLSKFMGQTDSEPEIEIEMEPPAPVKEIRAKTVQRNRPKIPLSELLVNVIGSKPMGVNDILEALQQNGWKSKSSDPRRILYLELKKQVEKGTIDKAARGEYVKK